MAYHQLKEQDSFEHLRAEAKNFLSVPSQEFVLVNLFDHAKIRPIADQNDLAWAQARAQKFRVIRLVQILTSLTNEVSVSKVKEWIDQMAAAGYNIVSLQDDRTWTVSKWGLENWKDIIRYGHSKGVRIFFHCTHSDPRAIIDTLGDPLLGDSCLDGVGFDYELARTDLKGTYFYSIDDIRADDLMVEDFRQTTSKDMKNASVEEIREWYGKKFAAWYGDIYRYLKRKNQRLAFWTTADWYDSYFARALVKECPEIIVQTYDYNRAPNAHYQHFVRAWQNAGAITVPIVLHRPNAHVPNVTEASMQAGADGIAHWRWMVPRQLEIFGAETNPLMLRYFPGDLSKPFAPHPPAPEFYAATPFWPWLVTQAQEKPFVF